MPRRNNITPSYSIDHLLYISPRSYLKTRKRSITQNFDIDLPYNKKSSIMKGLFRTNPSSNISKDGSTSFGSKYDQELGSNTTEMGDNDNDVIIMKNSSFLCFPLEMDLTLARVVLAEALGTFILMFSICGIIASTTITRGEAGLLEYAVTAAAAVIVVVFSVGSISGAHVNPAVTIAFATVGPFPWSKVPFYIMAQIVGSILATYAGKVIYGLKSELVVTRPLGGCAAAFWAEFMATFIILFLTASLIHAHKSVLHVSGFIVGVAIGLGVLITGPISGGSMNPARSIGPAILAWKFEGLWIYVTAPTIGAITGAFTLRILKPCSSLLSREADLHSHLASSEIGN